MVLNFFIYLYHQFMVPHLYLGIKVFIIINLMGVRECGRGNRWVF